MKRLCKHIGTRLLLYFDWDNDTQALNTVSRMKEVTFKYKNNEYYAVAPASTNIRFLDSSWTIEKSEYIPPRKYELIKDTNINGTLRDYQIESFSYMQYYVKSLLTDEMGLGKTITTIQWMCFGNKYPFLIVCPSSMKYVWKSEIEKFTDETDIEVLEGRTPYDISSKIVIINYDILDGWKYYLSKYGFKAVAFDEVHYLKNPDALRTLASLKIVENIDYRVGLSGTPFQNYPAELLSLFKVLGITHFEEHNFKERYCKNFTPTGYDYKGAQNLDELNIELRENCMIRHRKEDCLKELPEKTYNKITLELDNYTEYNTVESNYKEWVQSMSFAERNKNYTSIMGKMHKLFELSYDGKKRQCLNWIRDVIESGEKLVVFAHNVRVVEDIYQEFNSIAVKVNGSVKGQARFDAVERFQNDEDCLLFIGNIKSAGVGLTLTAGANVAFIQYSWSPADLRQCEDRCCRIGQTRGVNVYYLVGANTIDETVVSRAMNKSIVLDKVVDGQISDSGNWKEFLTEFLD